MAVLVLVSSGFAMAVVARLLMARGARPELALVALVFPGWISAIRMMTPELLALGLALLGLMLWEQVRRGPAVLLLTLAVLTRESMLLVPVVMLVHEAWRRRLSLRTVVALSTPVVAEGVWWVVVRWRVGWWPTTAGGDRITMPFRGLTQAVSIWHSPAAQTVAVVLGVVLLIAAATADRSDVLAWMAIGYGLFGVVLGEVVWARWEDFGRVLLPAYACAGVVAAARWLPAPREKAAAVEATSGVA
ncbi:MAG: hypothetical protein U0V73_11350 [Acidimicrobiia bacterium]